MFVLTIKGRLLLTEEALVFEANDQELIARPNRQAVVMAVDPEAQSLHRWPLASVTDVEYRTHKHEPVAIELFFRDGVLFFFLCSNWSKQ